MAQYQPQDLYNQAVIAIRDNNLFFIEDIVAWLPCDKTTFYRLFPVELPEDVTEYSEDQKKFIIIDEEGKECNGYNSLKALLDNNKIVTKSSIRAKLYKGSKAPELIALYKLICTDEERRSLSMQAIDHTSRGNELRPNIINLGTGTKPEEDE
jgi:hypothetical protein